jgi:hypothetical protein
MMADDKMQRLHTHYTIQVATPDGGCQSRGDFESAIGRRRREAVTSRVTLPDCSLRCLQLCQ